MNPRPRILVIDDDPAILKSVTAALERSGQQVTAMANPVEALTLLTDPEIAVALLDITLPHLSGLELLKTFRERRPDVEVIMLTGDVTLESAVAAVRAGAYDYLTKPLQSVAALVLAVERALDKQRLSRKVQTAEAALEAVGTFEGIIGKSAPLQTVFKLVTAVAPSTATVLISGESGTGKEKVARAIHARSDRREKPFLAINCSALTETLLESELFGHAKGAFTGAQTARKGLFEAAHGGTLFLDEIGDVSPGIQVRLLRVLQEGEIKPVGSNESVQVDVRVVAATHVDLEKAIAAGKFREDLYYRLKVVSLKMPPLRERPDDVPLLAHHFLRIYGAKAKKQFQGFSAAALKRLTLHRWPGNVRELENAIERATLLAQSGVVDADDLPDEVGGEGKKASDAAWDPVHLFRLPYSEAKRLFVSAFEKRYLANLLERSEGKVNAAAALAEMDKSNFRRLLKDHGLQKAAGADDRDG